jgi:hypothetical protein
MTDAMSTAADDGRGSNQVDDLESVEHSLGREDAEEGACDRGAEPQFESDCGRDYGSSRVLKVPV